MVKENGDYFNDLANAAYQVEKYHDALRYYKQAIVNDETNADYYCNRCSCHLKLDCYNDALEDAKSAAQIDQNSPRAYRQLTECYLVMGNYGQARYFYRQLEQLSPRLDILPKLLAEINQLESDEQQAIELMSISQFDNALEVIKTILEKSPASLRARSLQVECLIRQKDIEKAQDIYYEYLFCNEDQSEIKYLRALINYYQNDMDTAMKLCKSIVEYDLDYIKAVKLIKLIRAYKEALRLGSQAFRDQDYRKADTFYGQALDLDSTNDKAHVKLLVNRAIIANKMNAFMDAVAYGTKALAIDKNNLKAYVNRAEGYVNVGAKNDAIVDYVRAYELHKDESILRKLEKLKLEKDTEVKDEKNKDEHAADPTQKAEYDLDKFFEKYNREEAGAGKDDGEKEEQKSDEDMVKERLVELKKVLISMKTMKPHEVLGVDLDANENQIRKGYSKRVIQYHPDHVARYPQLKEVCEEIFKLVQNAKRLIGEKRNAK